MGGLWLLIVLPVLAVVGAIVLAERADNGTRDDDPAPTVWEVEPEEVSDGYGPFSSADGTRAGALLRTGAGWVGMTEGSTPEANLFSVDPDDGSVQWSVAMPEGRCTGSEDADLTCLRRTAGTFELVTVDPATGAIGDTIATGLTTVPWMIQALGDGWVTMDRTGTLSMIDADGGLAWTHPWDIGDAEPAYLQIETVGYDQAMVVYLGWYVGTAHLTVDGEVTTLPCHSVVATPQAWLCTEENDAGDVVGRDPAGVELWRGAGADYRLIDSYQEIAPVALVDNGDGSVSMVDASTGERGPAVQVGDSRDFFDLVGDATHPGVTTEDTVSLLAEDGTAVAWAVPLVDEYNNIADSVVVDDVLVVDGDDVHGFDLATGERLWEHDGLAGDMLLSDSELVGHEMFAIVRYELP